MEAKRAVVIGATGLIGSHLLELLLRDPYFSEVSALVRKPLTFSHPKLEAKITDFGNVIQLKEAMGSGDCIFCCIGTTMKKVNGDKELYRSIDVDIPLNAAKAGLELGFSHFLVVSSIGANTRSANFYLKLKGTLEGGLTAIPYPSVDIFRPSFLLGYRKEKRQGEKLIQSLASASAFFLRGRLKKYRAISAADVAAAMLAAAKRQQEGVHLYEYEQIRSLADLSNS